MKRKRITRALVVEDDKAIVYQIKNFILRRFAREIQVLIATTFKEASNIIHQGLIDIYIIDFGLPDGNGEELLTLVRQLYPKAPIIVQTTQDDIDYQVKIYKKFRGVVYITKKELFNELGDSVAEAKEEALDYEKKRLPLETREKIESIDVDDICFIEKIPNSKNLNIEYYNHRKGDYDFKIMNNVSLQQFIQEHNDSGYFLRCHGSFIVNKKMIEEVNKLDNCILLLHRRAGDNEVYIDIGDKFKNKVLEELKGFY